MGIFDNATSITINNKEVSSIKIGTATLYEKEEESSSDLILTVNTSELYDNIFQSDNETSEPFTFTGDNLSINWGDGTSETYTTDPIGHTYSNSGTYTITISGEITGINDYAFYASNMNGVIIPSSITTIGESVFSECDYLTSITFKSSTPPTIVSGDAFPNNDNVVIRVPTGSLSAYQNAENYPNSGYSNYTYVEY